MSSSCLEGIGNGRDRCDLHGGTFNGDLKCSKNPDPFIQAEHQAMEAFKRESARIIEALKQFPGWLYWGHTDAGWAAREDVEETRIPRREPRIITAPTPHGLIERVRQAANSSHREPQQGSLL